MSKARYILETIDNEVSTKSRAKHILALFEQSSEEKEKQEKLFSSIQDWISKREIKVTSVKKDSEGHGVTVIASNDARDSIDSALHKNFNLGYTVKTSDNSTTFRLR